MKKAIVTVIIVFFVLSMSNTALAKLSVAGPEAMLNSSDLKVDSILHVENVKDGLV